MNAPAPGLEETRLCLTDHDVVAVVLELGIGQTTPVAAMRALGTAANCFLLESVEGSGAVAQWSMLGHGPSWVISDSGADEDPLAILERKVASLRAACAPGMAAPLLGGAVGFLAYEAATRYERLPVAARDPLGLPHQWFAVFDTVAVFDHARHRLLLSSCVHRDDPAGVEVAHARALTRIAELRAAIEVAGPEPPPHLAGVGVEPANYEGASNTSARATSSRCRCRGVLPCRYRQIPSMSTWRCEPSTPVPT
jgi:anthranilate synthase component 1